MAIVFILTTLPVMLIITLLLAGSADLTPLAALGFAALVVLVGIVFIALIRVVMRMQPSERVQEERRHARDDALVEAGRQRRAEETEQARARWQDDGGASTHRSL